MSLYIVYAIHEFQAENEDEINFDVGEPIMVLEKDEKYLDGWWQGRNIKGETGLFPMNYTSTEKPKDCKYDAIKIFNEYKDLPITSRSSRSTIEEEIDQAISQLQVTSPPKDYPFNSSQLIQSPPLPPTILSTQDTIKSNPEQWDVEQVANWLQSVGFGSVASNFIDQEITGDILLDLNIDTLKELGINTFGKRYKIIQTIQSLKSGDSVKIEPNTSVSTGIIPLSHKKSNSSLKRSNSQTNPTKEGLYQYPRKAPLPPAELIQPKPSKSNRPISPQSLSSSGISRSNTFNTVSSGSTSKEDKSFKKPFQSLDSIQNDWMFNEVNEQDKNNLNRPINTPTFSVSTPNKQSSQIYDSHKLSVSLDEHRGSSTEVFEAPEHEGWLHKQSDKYKTWNKRWFVLKGSNLFYFKSPKDVRMKGIINLRGYKIIVDESIHAGKYCFKAQHERERTFYFYTDTKESMSIWLKMLMKTTIARDFRAPVMSSNHVATVSLDMARKMRPRPPSVIMYKNQKQIKSTQNESKMTPVIEDAGHYRQTRESGITEYHLQEALPSLPPLPTSNEFHFKKEDLIDPQHKTYQSQSNSESSSLSDHLIINEIELNYIDWLNQYLPQGKKIVDLTSAFRSGETLIYVLEGISGKEIRRPPIQKGGSVSVQMLDNIVSAFKFMGREGVEVDGRYTIKDVFGGNEEKIITMLDAIKVWADKYYPSKSLQE